jgi:hypothetical protein
MKVYRKNLRAYKPAVIREYLRLHQKPITPKALKGIPRTQAEMKADRHRANFTYVVEYLRSHPCVDCGEDDFVVLEFDHRDPAGKVYNIGSSLWNLSLEVIKAEIDKCDVRCCNCHRRGHSNRVESAQRYGLLPTRIV